MTQTHLVLVGLMGAGKSTVGAECARRLDRPFVDTDELVEAVTGATIAELFATVGEQAFRVHERAAVADACASPVPAVISCGGGAVLDPVNRRRLRDRGVVVWLRATPDVLADRVRADGVDRPLLGPAGAVTTLERLAVTRHDAYEAAAHTVVDTDGCTVDQVADAVLEAYRT
jgi:shikimate kinase